MNDDGVNLENFSPSWMEDGGDIYGDQQNHAREDVQDWDTNAWTEIQKDEDSVNGSPTDSCMSDAGDPPSSGTWVLGSIDGACQWIETTDCDS